MTAVIMAAAAAALVVAMLSVLLHWRAQKREVAAAAVIGSQLEEMLTLMQLTQKHRALGGQSDQSSVMQRDQISRQIERSWPTWLNTVAEGEAIAAEWKYISTRANDFAAHCRAIDRMIVVISRLERCVRHEQGAVSIADRCRALEDMGCLRGLSMRAANNTHCSIGLEVPLRYLCLRLSKIDSSSAALHAAVREISEQLLDAPRVAISPQRCFELLTPIIDAAIENIRRDMRHSEFAKGGTTAAEERSRLRRAPVAARQALA